MSFGPIAPQPTGQGWVLGEDCLHLNVWTPALADGVRRPVLVWFHPGAFSSDTSNRAETDGAGAEDDDLVAGLRVGAVDGVQGDGHRLVERGHLPRHVVRDDLQLAPGRRVGDQDELRERALGPAAAEQPVGEGHRVDDDVTLPAVDLLARVVPVYPPFSSS